MGMVCIVCQVASNRLRTTCRILRFCVYLLTLSEHCRPPALLPDVPHVSLKEERQQMLPARPHLGAPSLLDNTPASSMGTAGRAEPDIRTPIAPDPAALKANLVMYKPHGAATLLGCLQRFVRPEQLGDAGQWLCDRLASRNKCIVPGSCWLLHPKLLLGSCSFN